MTDHGRRPRPGCPNPRPVRARKTFENFDLDEGNKLAYTAARAVAEHPGIYNPLVLFGPSGTGKTHLVRAIAHYVGGSHPRYRASEVAYVATRDAARRILLERPANGDLLVIGERAGQRCTGIDVLLGRRQQIVLSCRSQSAARAILKTAGLTDRALIVEIAQSTPRHSTPLHKPSSASIAGYAPPLSVEISLLNDANCVHLPSALRARAGVETKVIVAGRAAMLPRTDTDGGSARAPEVTGFIAVWPPEYFERWVAAALASHDEASPTFGLLSRVTRAKAYATTVGDDGMLEVSAELRKFAGLEHHVAILEFWDHIQICRHDGGA